MKIIMKKSIFPKVLMSLLIIVMVLASGCNGMPGLPGMSGATEPTAEATAQPITEMDGNITAEGKLVPKDSVQLAFTTSGQVAEVLIKEGDLIKKGETLARLSGRKQLEAAIAAAEFELFSAQQALQALEDDLGTAQNQALAAVNTARQAVHDTERRANSLGGVADKNDIDIANTQVIFAKNALDKAQENFDRYANYPEDNLIRAKLKVELANKQKEYDAAVRKYNALTGSASNFDREQAITDLAIAQTQLKLAQEKYDTLLKGPDPDAVANAKARITSAETQMAASKADLEKLDLIATIDGKVVASDLKPGITVTPGQPVIEIADFSEWDVDTDNLTEIEVVDVNIGQKVTVTPDALPDIKLSGEVIKISDTFEEKRGDITYTVRIKLNEVDPRLRWGMTVVVDFEQ
jgi:multidrug resistance efflux pump